jgi:ubiquinone/menaquinone biosynthesis C-methylase UbiE
MPVRIDPAVKIQRTYYTHTAAQYDSMHANEGATDPAVTKYVHGFLQVLNVRSVLDIGCATAQGTASLQSALPDAFVCGVEPVAALADRALEGGIAPRFQLLRATGEALPFGDAAFDAVCEFGMLHHVPQPAAVVKEMLRVARRAVFICDSNRFGQGSFPARLVKLVLYKARLWPLYTHLRTGGRGYMITEGDGLFYSYSIYDSYDLVAAWADRIFLIPSAPGKATSWFHPLLTSSGVILCAVRERE